MTQHDAALVSLPEFIQRHNGWERRSRTDWEIARWMVWHEYLNNPYIKQGRKPHDPKCIVKFSWEGENEPPVEIIRGDVTEQEKQELDKIFEQLEAKNKQWVR